ncbi:MAG: hypothetical protein MKZ70_02315, partial [Opitutales bacterium]|nr:hypothetical protein [Opitutales bacterium]
TVMYLSDLIAKAQIDIFKAEKDLNKFMLQNKEFVGILSGSREEDPRRSRRSSQKKVTRGDLPSVSFANGGHPPANHFTLTAHLEQQAKPKSTLHD